MSSDRKGDWCQRFDGGQVFAWDPRPEDIEIRSLARGLLEPRFQGQTRDDRELYMVAEHCVRGSYVVPPEEALAFLLHDGHEWLFRDVGAPVKRHVDMVGYKQGAECFQQVINQRFGLSPVAHHATAVKHADLVMLATEQRDLMGPAPAKWLPMPDPLPDVIVPWTWREAERRFLARFEELTDVHVGGPAAPPAAPSTDVRRLRRIEWAARHVHDGAALEPLLTRERVEAHMHARGWTRGEERATGGYYWIHAEHDAITLPLRPSRVWWQSHFALGGYDVSDAIAVLADMLPEHGEWENVHG